MSNDGGAPEILFDKMMSSFRVTLDEISKDKVLLDAFRLYRRELGVRLDQVDLALVELSKTSSKAAFTFDDLKPTILKIAKGLQGAYRLIRVETNKGPRTVDISKIYIPSKLRYRETKSNAEKVTSITRVLGGGSKKSSGPELFSARHEVAQEHLVNITYSDLRLLFNRVVVLGDPGGGKSTLCQHLCHDLAKQAAASLQADSGRLTAQLQKVPIRIILRAYEKARTLEAQLSIFEFILRDLKNHVSAENDELDRALRYLLASGSAVLAFDGLDEILATAQRRDFVDLVNSFCLQFPLCPVIVTSRLVGYDDAPLPAHFDELILEKFDDEEVRSYVTKFMKVVGGYDEKEAQKRAANFHRQTTNNAADLRRNPLMLGLMAWLFNMRGDVPSNRPEIYRECAVLMFEKWIRIATSKPAYRLISTVCSYLVTSHPRYSGILNFPGVWMLNGLSAKQNRFSKRSMRTGRKHLKRRELWCRLLREELGSCRKWGIRFLLSRIRHFSNIFSRVISMKCTTR